MSKHYLYYQKTGNNLNSNHRELVQLELELVQYNIKERNQNLPVQIKKRELQDINKNQV